MSGRSISLVLGGGGARGLAHIGVIRWLEAHDFTIDAIAGSSIGALVGGIYAAGKLDAYADWVSALERRDVLRMLDFSFRGGGLVKGERIINFLRELVGERNIEDLPISFTAVATDVEEQKEVWLRHGSLFDAIRASIAVPVVFKPHRVQGRYLLDGGLINPVPIAPTLNDNTDLTIAVNLSGPPTREPARVEIEHRPVLEEYRRRIKQFIETLGGKNAEADEDERGFFEVLTQVVDTVENTIARFKLAAYSPDYIVEIPRNACALFDFHRARELIALGWQRADQTLAQIRDE